jgi:hypothetical protein
MEKEMNDMRTFERKNGKEGEGVLYMRSVAPYSNFHNIV